MRKTAAIIGIALLGAAIAAPAQGAANERSVTETYTMATGAFVGHGEAHWTLGAEYEAFRAERGEKAVSFSIEDDFGQPVRGHVHIDRDGDGELDDQLDFCGSTTKPIAVRGGSVVEVGTIFGLCNESSPSIVTEGTITATFTK